MNLLIVDDERYVVNWICELFKKRCPLWQISCAYSAPEALALLEQVRIDIVISDIHMPGMSGIDLMHAIQAKFPHCQVIFLTGYSEFDYVYEAIQHGNVQYLLKTEEDEAIEQAALKAAARLGDAIESKDPSGNYTQTVMQLVCEYIEAHIAEDLSLNALAARVAYNPSYLSRAFKQHMGTNLNQYVTGARMQRAKELLSTSYLAVSEIASAVGFDNAQYFSTAFKRLFGETPQKYRAKHIK